MTLMTPAIIPGIIGLIYKIRLLYSACTAENLCGRALFPLIKRSDSFGFIRVGVIQYIKHARGILHANGHGAEKTLPVS
ncbi:hypothetical protein [Burkholderia sp. Bp9090]|uniref:hypothetical protein n=1 Tax=Burkholderia sp. Bp9090 TaxID=2184567 RepID=UPI000F5DC66F|nr:hypothetical protein [Burkholderia sp. Bp9090]